jgi:signal peptidase I
MNLFEVLGIDLKVFRNNPKDSVLVTIRKPNGQVRTAVVKPGSEEIDTSPEYLAQAPIHDKELTRKKALRYSSNVLYVVSGLLIVLILGAKLTGFGEARIVITGSMVPAINPGDMVVTVNDKYVTPKLNDVVIYEAKRFNGEVVSPFAHRIIGGNATSGWIMKGDANEQADVQRPKASDITGVVMLVIPHVGDLINIKSLIFLAVIIISIYLTKEILRPSDE